MKWRFNPWPLFGVLVLLLAGCSDDDDITTDPRQQIPPTDFTFAEFNPAAGDPALAPLPNDFLRNPATGFLSLPGIGDPAVDALINQVNTLQGFSTTAPMRIPFDGKVNAATVNNQTVLLVDLVDLAAAAQGAQVDPIKPMRLEVNDDESGDNSIVLGFPEIPLKPGRAHLVVLTRGVIGTASGEPVESNATTILTKNTTPLVDANGNSLRPSLNNATAQALEPLRAAYQSIWEAAEQVTGQPRVLIPMAFAFTTQPLFDTLAEMRTRAKATAPDFNVQVAVLGSAQVDGFFQFLDQFFPGASQFPNDSIGSIFLGQLNTINYLSDPVNGPIQGSGADIVEVDRQDLVYVAALPQGDGPFPTVVFQHGIGTRKEFLLGVADSFNSQGIAVIGIDMVLHGDRVADTINNDTGAPGPDGQPDPDGTGFINLTNLLMSRDNLRQSVSDLYHLTHFITSGAADFNGDGQADLLPTGTTFLGTSLGAMVGTSFIATEPDVASATLNFGGGRFAYLLQESESFGPAINAGLAGFGLTPGSALYDLYFLFAQAIVDDADPSNYALEMSTGSLSGGAATTVLLQEAVGDTVVPNTATREFAAALAVPQVGVAIDALGSLAQVAAPHAGSGYYQFDSGHLALILPTDGPTAEIQTQAITYHVTALTGQPTIIDPFAGAAKNSRVIRSEIPGVNAYFDPSRVVYIRK